LRSPKSHQPKMPTVSPWAAAKGLARGR